MANGEDFWKRVDHQRDILSLKKNELWRAIHKSRSTATGWIQFNRIPPGDVCLAIAEVLGTSVQYLITGEEVPEWEDEVGETHGSFSPSGGSSLVPRDIPADVAAALPYCTDEQISVIRKVLDTRPETKRTIQPKK